MSTSPRMDGDRRAVSIIPHYVHITDSTGFPLCCYEPQPAPLRNGDDCPLCADIAKFLPDAVVVRLPQDEEVLPFSEPLEDDVCELCGGDGMLSIPITKHYGRIQVADWYTGPCPCQTRKR